MEAWKQKITDAAVHCIQNDLAACQAETEALVNAAPPETLAQALDRLQQASDLWSKAIHPPKLWLEILDEHSQKGDVSTAELIAATRQALQNYSLVTIAHNVRAHEFYRDCKKTPLPDDLRASIEGAHLSAIVDSLNTRLVAIVGLRHFFALHLDDLLAISKKSNEKTSSRLMY